MNITSNSRVVRINGGSKSVGIVFFSFVFGSILLEFQNFILYKFVNLLLGSHLANLKVSCMIEVRKRIKISPKQNILNRLVIVFSDKRPGSASLDASITALATLVLLNLARRTRPLGNMLHFSNISGVKYLVLVVSINSIKLVVDRPI